MYGMAQTHASIGIKTTVVGFGRDKDAILFMENLSSNGKGSFIRIKSEEDARNALLQEIMSNALR
jgi:regulator of RNase E activity RraA